MSLWQLINTGGATIYILLFCSVLSVAIMIERIVYYRRRSLVKRKDFMQSIRKALEKKDIKNAQEIAKAANTPFADVVAVGLSFHGHDEKEISEAMEREIIIETTKLERFTTIVGTIGSTAVYIGLFGTVLGIIRAFQDISVAGSGGLNVVIRGISEALVCTATGLAVAVPAVIVYNFFIKRIDNFIIDMELCVSETMDLLT